MTRLFLFLGLFLFLSAAARAEEMPPAAKIAADGEITLTDNRILTLAGIRTTDKAQTVLMSLTGSHKLSIEDAVTDRYGRIAGQVYVVDDKGNKIWLQGELLRQGLAFLYPPTGAEARLDEMRAIEARAHAGKTGLWADETYADVAAENAGAREGGFAFVTGKVFDTNRTKDKVYINFGPDWHSDFAVQIAAHDLHNFRKANFDPLALTGKTIRVRGWIKRQSGPMIAVTHPAQIEILKP